MVNPILIENKIPLLCNSPKFACTIDKRTIRYSRVNFLGTHFLGTNGIFEKNLMLTF